MPLSHNVLQNNTYEKSYCTLNFYYVPGITPNVSLNVLALILIRMVQGGHVFYMCLVKGHVINQKTRPQLGDLHPRI